MVSNRIFRPIPIIALALCSALIIMLPASPRAASLPGRDSGVFLYIGSHILDGEVPYRDVWDHKPPTIFYLNALGLFLASGSRWGVWLLEVTSLGAAIAIGYSVIRTAFGNLPALFGSALWVITLPFILQGGNLTTEYTLPLQFAALFLVIGTKPGKDPKWRWFLVGILGGVAYFTKQTAIGIWIALFLYLTILRLHRKEPGRYLGDVLAMGLGAMLVGAFWVLLFGSAGALRDFWDAAFRFNFNYVSSPDSPMVENRIITLLSGNQELATVGLLPIATIGFVMALVLVLWYRSGIRKWTPLLIVVTLNLPIEIILINLSGFGYPHYYLTMLPSLAILAAFTFCMLLAALAQQGVNLRGLKLVTLGTLVVFSIPGLPTYSSGLLIFMRGTPPNPLVEQISEMTASTDSVLFWGAEAVLNFTADRESPSRYIYQYPLYADGYVTEEMVTEFLSSIVQACPALIIDTQNPMTTPIWDFPITSVDIQSQISNILTVYHVESVINNWTVYARINESCSFE